MATMLHEVFAFKLATVIKERYESLAEIQVETRPFINKITPAGGRLHFKENGKKFKHVPDIMFYHQDAVWPGVVIEVSYSQRRKSLVNLADDYLLASDGGIRLMVGMDLEYRKSKKASISTWRLKILPGDDGQPEGDGQPEDEVIRESSRSLTMR